MMQKTAEMQNQGEGLEGQELF